MYRLLGYIILSFITLPFEIITATTPSEFYTKNNPHLLPEITFTPQEMLVMPLEEWSHNGPDIPEITAALAEYHNSQAYTLSLNEFKANPSAYFDRRKQALKTLIDCIPCPTENVVLQQLHSQAENKLLYIQTLPDILNPLCTKPEALPYSPKRHLKISEKYWNEFLDPLHRYGFETAERVQRWQASSIPNFFIYLETTEYDPLLNKYAPMHNQVQYLYNGPEREQQKINFLDGLAYINGIPLETKDYHTIHSGEGFAIFVLSLDKEFYVNDHVKFRLHHSSPLAGEDVLGAGEILAHKGIIFQVSNKSGHYSPSDLDMLETLQFLKNKLGDISKVQVQLLQRSLITDTVEVATYNAEDYLSAKGRTLPIYAEHEWTPLHLAAWKNYIELLAPASQTQDINAKNDLGNTALHLAVEEGHHQTINILLSIGADPDVANNAGETPLHLSAKLGDLDTLQFIYPYSSFPAHRNNKGETLLLNAAQSGDLNCFDFLINKGFSADDSDFEGNTVFHCAACASTSKLLSHLAKNLNLRDKLFQTNLKGASPLHTAAAFGSPRVMRFLIGQGFDINSLDNHGNSVLHYAAKESNTKTSEYLLSGMISKELYAAKNNDGVTALHIASATLSFSAFEVFISKADDVNSRDNQGRTPLFYAIAAPKTSTTKNMHLLINHGADLHSTDNNGLNPIHVAATTPNSRPIMRLLTYADDISLTDSEGNTPLHAALYAKKEPVAFYLIQYAPKELVTMKNNLGKSPIDIARDLDLPDVLRLLQEKLTE